MDNKKELEAYDSIIQNLEVSYDGAGDIRPEEKKALRHILYTLSSLRICVRSPDERLNTCIETCASCNVN